MQPKQSRRNLSLRTFSPKTGRNVRGVDIQNVSAERAGMIKRAYVKAAANIAPKLGVRAVETPSESTSGKVTVSKPSRSSISLSGISQKTWDKIFGKKRKK